MGIVFGLLAAFCWGLGDYLITHLTRRVGTSRALLFIQVVSLLAWLIILVLGIQRSTPAGNFNSTLWLMAFVTGIFHVLGLALTYRAFEVGTLSLVSPIASGFAVVTAVLSYVSGEHPPALTLAGALCLIGGLALATRSPDSSPADNKPTLAGVPEALGSALAFGAMFWMFYFFVEPRMGYVWPLILLKIMASSASLLSVLAAKHKLKRRAEETVPVALLTGREVALALGAAGTDTLAWLAYIWGSKTQYATVVTALASLFSVVTVLLAWVLLRERLAPYQWLGVATILLGILLVSI